MSDAFVTCLILAGTIALFLSDRLRLDVVAVISLLALSASGVVTLDQALAGFASPAMLMIAGLFVVGAALTNTGVADWLGQWLERNAGRSEASVVLAVVCATALLSAFMSSTGTVAILLPVVVTLAHRRGIAPSRLLMPLAFGAHLGSNLTLIATPPNVLVSDALLTAGREPFRFFSFTGPGIVVLVCGVAYLAMIGRRLLPGTTETLAAERTGAPDLASEYGFDRAVRTLRIDGSSPMVGRTLAESNLRARYGVSVLGIESSERVTKPVVPVVTLAVGDELRVLGREEAIATMVAQERLLTIERPAGLPLAPDESLAEVVLPRRSKLVGRTLREARFRDRYRANVLCVRHGDGAVERDPVSARDLPLRVGDTLLVKGKLKHLRALRSERADMVLVTEPDTGRAPLVDPEGARIAVTITLVMLLVMALGILPNVIAVFAAAVAMVVMGCVRPVDVYASVNWESIVLIACMLPLATALETSGAIAALVAGLEGQLSGASPHVVLALLVMATSTMGMVLSNTTTAVLLAPVAMRLSVALDVAPEPLLIGVAFASSAAFATPIASPVNVLVMGPAGYRFVDFVRVGLPLQLLVLALTVIVVPMFWSFG